MSCSPAFSLTSLDGSSQETEGTHSLNCVSNLFKLVIFSFWLICLTVAFFAILLTLILELRRKTPWNPQKRAYLILLVTTLGLMIRLCLHIAGVNRREIYIVFFITESFYFTNFFCFIRDCFMALTLIHHPGEEKVGKVLKQFDLFFAFGITFTFAGFLLCRTIGPIIFFDAPATLNWFFVFGLTHSSVVTFFAAGCFYRFSRKLRDAILPALELEQRDRKLIRFVAKLDVLSSVFRMTFPAVIITGLAPIWMAVSSSPTNPGMQYFFYAEFLIWMPAQLFTITFFLWFMERRYFELGGSSANHNENSHSRSQEERASFSKPYLKDREREGTFPSIPIEELVSPPEA